MRVMAVSVFDLFKIGIGPSSSHTVGPMRARAAVRRSGCAHDGSWRTRRAHAVRALRLARRHRQGPRQRQGGAARPGGHEPDTVDVDAIPALLDSDARRRALRCSAARSASPSTSSADLVFHRRETLPFHANGMRFTAFDADGAGLANRVYYSVGGGFVVSDEVAADGTQQKVIAPDTTVLPLPVPQRRRAARSTTRELLRASPQRDARQRAPLAQRRRDRRRPAAHLARDAGLRGARLPHRRRAARRLQGPAARAGAVPRS